MLPLNTNIRLAYANGKDDEQNFIQNLSLFLCTFLKEHGQLIEKRLNLRETLMEVREMSIEFIYIDKLQQKSSPSVGFTTFQTITIELYGKPN